MPHSLVEICYGLRDETAVFSTLVNFYPTTWCHVQKSFSFVVRMLRASDLMIGADVSLIQQIPKESTK